jgi:hypothetical protein
MAFITQQAIENIEADLQRLEVYMIQNATSTEEHLVQGREAYNNMLAARTILQVEPNLVCGAILCDSYRTIALMHARGIRRLRRLRTMAAERMVDLMSAQIDLRRMQAHEPICAGGL